MVSPAARPSRSPRLGPDVGDAGVVPFAPDAAHRVLLLAHEVAQDTLADAQRLAAGVLAEAGRQADALVDEASDTRARSAAQQAAASLAESINTRQDHIVAMLAQFRDDLRDVAKALPRPRVPDAPATQGSTSERPHRELRGRRTSLLATDPNAALSASDEEFVSEVFRRIAGVEPSHARGATLSHPDDRVVAVLASARRAAQRATAERVAIQAEALERMAQRRHANQGASHLAGERGEVVVSMTERRPASPNPG